MTTFALILCAVGRNVSGAPSNASLALMPEPQARLQALIDLCMSRCAQKTQLTASAASSSAPSSSQSHTEHTEGNIDVQRETTGSLLRAASGDDFKPTAPNDAALSMATQAPATCDGSVWNSSSGAANANASAPAITTSGPFASHSFLSSTLRHLNFT